MAVGHDTGGSVAPRAMCSSLGRLPYMAVVISLGFVAGRPLSSFAQDAPPSITASNGFSLQSSDGDNRLQFGVLLHVDGRFSLDTPAPITNTFALRKVRPIIAGRVARFFDFRVAPDFGNGTAVMTDAYFDIRFSTAFRVRTGKDKTPVGYEYLISDAALLFPERALASSLVPNRDVGVQALGDLAGGRLSYSAGVFNGVADGASSSSDVDTNAGKDLAGRLIAQPFRTATPTALSGLGFQIGGSFGAQTGALPSFRTSSGSQTFFTYAGASGAVPAAVADGTRRRVTPSAFYYYKSFDAIAEFMRTTQTITRGTTTREITNHGWEISGAYLLTGERASAGVAVPRLPFDPPAGRWGAVQIVARYSELVVDDEAFAAGLAAATSSRKAQSVSMGLNWSPVLPVKYYLTFERTVFDGPVERPAEHIVLFRAQAAF